MAENKKIKPNGQSIQSILNENSWMMEPTALEQFMYQVHQNITFKEENIKPEMFGLTIVDDDDTKPYRMDGSIAVIEIRGSLLKRASGFLAFLFGVGGMETIGKSFKKAIVDSEVKGIFLDTDSPGGSADGTFDLADIVYAGRGQKPILAFADGKMTSSAAAIGSGADYVVAANEITNMGSIGVYGVHMDYADRAKELGIKPTVFHAGKYKAIGNQYEHLSGTDKKYIQESFDYLHTHFINLISRNTGIPVDNLDSDLKEAKIFMGSQAISVGLANAVMNRDQAMALLRDVAEGKTTFEKHKIDMNQINLTGGEYKMENEKEMKAKIEDLERKLETAQALITEMNTNGQKATFESQIAGLTAEKTTLSARITELEASETALQTTIATMKTEAADNDVFVTAGKAHIEAMKAGIQKLSAQVDAAEYNKDLVDKQLNAFGNDIELLKTFSTNLQSRLDKMVKHGHVVPDVPAGTEGKKTDAQLYDIGKKIVPANIRVVK